MAEVRLEGVSKSLGDAEVLAGVTLTVRDGELFTIVGPSGCGKSTLLHLIAGLESPTGGQILFDGRDVTPLTASERDVALVFQQYALYPHMTVAENLAFPLRVVRRKAGWTRQTIEAEVRRVAETLGLLAFLQKRPRELSGGQQQRVALGRALIRKPRVFLLDEPLSNLDAQLRAGMRAELRRLHDELGVTMIYVTHDQAEAMTLGDRIAVLDRGQIQQIGAPPDIYHAPANDFVAGFIGHPAMNLLHARVERGHVIAGAIRVPLPSGVAGQVDGEPVKLGLRPEQVRVSDLQRTAGEAGPVEGMATGLLRLVEPMGGQTWVTVTVEVIEPGGPTTIVGLADEALKARPGARVAISLAGAVPHLFDPKTGVRIDG